MRFILLAVTAYREGDYHVAQCKELGTSSFGRTPKQAFSNIDKATLLFLDTLEDLGECEKVLAERKIKVYDWPAESPAASEHQACSPDTQLFRTLMMPMPARVAWSLRA